MPKILSFLLVLAGLSFSCARSNFYQKTALVNPLAFRQQPHPDSALVTVGKHYQKSGFHNLFFGKHYRNLWATEVTLPVFNMHEAAGGLTPVSMGGGFQTTSLSLKNKEGRPYVLRSIDKDPLKTLPPFLRNTFLINIIRDQTSAGNPFAPLVVPNLSEAAGVFYTHPKIYYVTENDTTFGKFGDRIKGKVMLLEEKYDGKEALTPMFGKATDLADSENVLEDHFEDSNHQIDQQLFARSRLFDILIGDWDRHEGQWQWAVYKSDKKVLYKPIPKDRDQVFYKFNDGIITWLASRPFAIRKFQTFKEDFGYLPGWMYNARFIDARALNEVTRKDWQRLAQEIKTNLTDDVISQAFINLPKPIYQNNAAATIKILKARRDKLPEAAEKIYLHLAEEVLVAGSDEAEVFEITRLASGETQVLAYQKADKTKTPFFNRTFRPSETEEINIYGLGGGDEFLIKGEARHGIMLHIYGGEGEDEVEDTSKVGGSGKKTVVHDTKRGVTINSTKEIKKNLKRDVAIHAFDREGL